MKKLILFAALLPGALLPVIAQDEAFAFMAFNPAVYKPKDISPEPAKYTVTVAASPEEGGRVEGGGEYEEGTEVSLTAVPSEHYHFERWDEKNNRNKDNPRVFTITQDTPFTAIFEKDRYTVTVKTNNDTYGSVSGGGSHEYGSEVLLWAMQNNGYIFMKWEDGETKNPRKFIITADTSFKAIFGIVCYITVWGDHGYVDGGGYYGQGAEVVLEAKPDWGYSFDRWEDGSRENPRTVIAEKDITYRAYFSENPITDTVDAPKFVDWQPSYRDSAWVELRCDSPSAQIWYHRAGGLEPYTNWKGGFYVYKTTKIEAFAMAAYMVSSPLVSAVYNVVSTQGGNGGEEQGGNDPGDDESTPDPTPGDDPEQPGDNPEQPGDDPNADNEAGNAITAVRVYPNPANGVVNISGEYHCLTVINASGQAVKTVSGVREVSLTNEPKGVYFFRFTTPSGIQTVKLVLK